ncbi:MAG: amino acid adenylation domain-containing protein [Prevotellaceae bacterium]|nr:amino acid adenylation domain-containing protein [Candidatus Faecinaster equi]
MKFAEEIIRPFTESITTCADRNAFCIDEKFYTYRELAEQMSKIRTAIHGAKFHHKEVGLVVNDDIETYASIWALWLEGLCYVPLHPGWPIERCMDIVGQVKIDLILDSSNGQSRYAGRGMYAIINTNQLQYTEDCLVPNVNISDEDLAYILFTSGSTGKPKGVQLTRGNVAAFMDSFWKTGIEITSEDRCLQCFDLTFDVSVQGYLVPLLKGACCYTVPHGQVKYMYVSGLIEDHQITFGAMAPSMLRCLMPYFDELDATSLRYCILTAEACPLDLMEAWYKCATNTEIYDFYGPTEATIYCSYYKLTKGGENKSLNGIISVGQPFANVTAKILDEAGNELPRGEKGELCVAGPQVTKGYWENPEKNASSFFFKDGVRYYHTGDLCYQDVDGDIMYSGRLDHQAKIQGFRVELGEIEFHAREYLKTVNAVCVAFDNNQHLTEIGMFIESEEFDTTALLEYMGSKMPHYMIPKRIVFVPVFPLNGNDKIDKNKLKELL